MDDFIDQEVDEVNEILGVDGLGETAVYLSVVGVPS